MKLGNCIVCKLVSLLVIIGAINWGLMAFDHNLVTALLGNIPKAVKITYILIGIAGLMKIASCFNMCPCQKGECSTPKK